MEYAIGYTFRGRLFFMILKKYCRLSVSEKAECGICYRVHVSEKADFNDFQKVLSIKCF